VNERHLLWSRDWQAERAEMMRKARGFEIQAKAMRKAKQRPLHYRPDRDEQDGKSEGGIVGS
jgi:hypothetical protein